MNSFIIENMEEKLLISSIEPQKKKKDRYNIYIDGEYMASLGAEAIVTFGLREGMLVDAETLKEAVSKDNAQYAFDSAASLLSHKMRTRSELKDRLTQRGIDEAAVEAAINKLSAYGYVDDLAYAKDYVQSAVHTGRWGRKAVEYRLAEKGLEREVIAEAMTEYTEEDEKRIVRAQIAGMTGKSSGMDARKQRQKIYASLARHGFDYGVINTLLSEDDD